MQKSSNESRSNDQELPVANADTSKIVTPELDTDVESADSAPETKPDQSLDRLLAESKKYKQRAQDAEKRLKQLADLQKSEQGKYKELFEERESEVKNLRLKIQEFAVRNTVIPKATESGCVDIEALFRLGDMETLEIDEDGDVHNVDGFLENAKKRYPYLFSQTPKATINPKIPASGPSPKTDLKSMSRAERLKALAAKW